MTEKWEIGLCSCSDEMSNCLLSACCSFIGVGIVQSKSFEIGDRGKCMPILCSSLFCCLGASYNRSKTRKYFKIKGNYFVDCLLYSTPLCCLLSVQEYKECKLRKENFIKKAHAPPPPIRPLVNPETEPSKNRVPSLVSLDFNESVSIKDFPELPESIFFTDNSYEIAYSKEKKEAYFTETKEKHSSSDRNNENNNEPEIENELVEIQVEKEISIKIIKEIGIAPIDGNNPQIYSITKGTGPFSFLKGDPYNRDCPPPTYMTLEYLKKPKATVSSQIMQGLEKKEKDGGLVCTDKEAIAKQKGIISEVFKSVVSNIAKGLGAVSISLPVRIFEPRSTCERLVDRFSFAPIFLVRAASCSDAAERMMLTMAFAVSGLYLGSKQEKPFNPLLGETFQGHLEDGTLIYVEHTAHNPPTDHFDLIGKGYRLFGYYELDGKLSFNELAGEFRGITNLQFADNQVISFTQPKFILGGTMFGDRTLNWQGEMEFRDFTSGLSGAIRIGDDKNKWGIKKKSIKKDDFFGKVWRTDSTGKKGDVVYTVYGSWLKKFTSVKGNSKESPKEKVWVIDRETPVRHIPVDVPLPSDWRYREDLIWLSKGNLDYAAGWKVRVENRQREDRKLRGLKH